MTVHELLRRQRLPPPPEEVFPFFGDARNLEAITPPWLGFRVITPDPIPMRVGTLIAYRLKLHGVAVSWLTSIQDWVDNERFVDQQVRGPYALWHHTHTFAPDGRGGTVMSDHVRYALPLGPLGELAHRAVVRRDLDAIFAFRRDAVAARLA
ncbi:MAG TPA: SRPBCC family protein [Solirubrobacteraceae bacterium]|nr:SRPBCC family protein [Solirubrobacteraceae bacterium]